MTHPLTDDTIQYVKKLGIWTWIYTENDLRAAADWQLEQVIEWMKVNLMKHDFHEGEELLKDLREAMRPTQEDN